MTDDQDAEIRAHENEERNREECGVRNGLEPSAREHVE